MMFLIFQKRYNTKSTTKLMNYRMNKTQTARVYKNRNVERLNAQQRKLK